MEEEEAVIATERAFVLEAAEPEARGEIEDFVTALLHKSREGFIL